MVSTLILIFSFVVTGIFAAVVVAWLTRRADDPREVTSWAAAYGVRLTPVNRAFVTYYVRMSITLRVIGGVTGIVLGHLFDAAFGVATSTDLGFWAWVISGWVAGACWAERQLPRPAGGEAAASLTPRRLGDYVPRMLRVGPVAAGGIAVAVAAAGMTAPASHDAQGYSVPTDRGLIAVALVTIALTGSVVLLLRGIVARRQPVAHPDIVTADDAVRASTLHHVSAGGTAALLAVGGRTASWVLLPRHLPFGVRGWVPVAFALGTLVAWRFVAYRAWRVRRPGLGPDTPAGPVRQGAPVAP